jgi:hypothetical protein
MMMDSGGRTLAIVLALLAGILTVGLVIVFDQVDHLFVWIMTLAIFLIGAVRMAVRWARGTFDLFESFNGFWLLFFMCFGAGALFTLYVPTVATDPGVIDYLDLACFYCLIGFLCAMVGYLMTGRFVPARTEVPGAHMGWAAVTVLYLLGSGGQFTFAFLERIPASLRMLFLTGGTSLLSQLDFFAFFALFYVCFMIFSKQATIGYKVVLFGIMIPTQAASLFLRFGNKTPLFLAIAMPIIAYWYARRRLAWKTLLVVGVISVIFIFPLYYTVRNIKSRYYSQAQRIEKTLDSVTMDKADIFARDALRTTARRFAIINSTATIVRDCGTRVEFAYGRTLYLGIVTTAIPRILWPNKPSTNIGLEVGKTFHMAGFSNYSQIAPSQIGELYWNFHVPGIVVGMFLIGVWLRVLYLRFGANQGSNPFRLAVYVVLLYTTYNCLDGGLGSLPSAMLRQGVMFLVLEKFFLVMESIGQRRAVRLGPEAAYVRP